MQEEQEQTKKLLVGKYEIELSGEHQIDQYQNKWKKYDKRLGELSNILWEQFGAYCAVDIGANVGDSAALINNKYDIPVLCIEGGDKFIPLLKKNLSRFKALTEIYEGFVGISEQNILEYDYHDGTLSLIQNINKDVNSNQSIITLESILTEHKNFYNPKLIKIDTDGMDFLIIKNSLDVIKRSEPVLFFEYDLFFRKQFSFDESLSTINALIDLGYSTFFVYDNFGNLMTVVDSNYLTRFNELNDYLVSNKTFGTAVFYYDICAIHRNDKVLAEVLSDFSRNDLYKNYENYLKEKKEKQLSGMIKDSELLIEQDNYSEAKKMLKKILSVQPDNSDALINMAVVEMNMNNYEAANTILKKILTIDPLNEVAIYNKNILESILEYEKENG